VRPRCALSRVPHTSADRYSPWHAPWRLALACVTGAMCTRVTTSEELAGRAVLIAREALDKLVEFGRDSGATDETAIDASRLVVEKRHVTGGQRDLRATREGFTANNLLMGMYDELRERDAPEVERIDSLKGHYLLDDGDEVGALAAADEMIEAAETIDTDAWNEDDLLHNGHIVRGLISLRRGDVPAAASELLAAAAAPDTSGRPDLELALALVEAGQDEAVLTYLRAIASWGSLEPD
jgi:hypothetical protein